MSSGLIQRRGQSVGDGQAPWTLSGAWFDLEDGHCDKDPKAVLVPVPLNQLLCTVLSHICLEQGEPIKVSKADEDQLAEYEQLVNSFYENLKAKRKMTKLMQEQNRRLSLKKILKKFPGWDEMTISNLHNLFLLFDDNKNAMLNLEDFCALLESLGDNSTYEVRSAKFDEADANKDGWINYDEFLPTIYYFDPPVDGVLRGLGKSCFEASENIRFISNLTVGEQLEYGLF